MQETTNGGPNVARPLMPGPIVSLPVPAALIDVAKTNPSALALFAVVFDAYRHRPGKAFTLPAGRTAKALRWSPPRYRKAMSALVACGALEVVSAGGNGGIDPARFRLPTTTEPGI